MLEPHAPRRGQRNLVTLAADVGLFDDDSVQVLRAEQLQHVGATRAARRVRTCGLRDPLGHLWSCRDRSCPRCVVIRCSRDERRLLGMLRHIEQPLVVVAALVAAAEELGIGIRDLRHALARLRRRKVVLERRVAGAVEHARIRAGWLVHAHLVIGRGAEALPRLASAWERSVGSAGVFKEDPHKTLRSPVGFARYVTKPKGWSPLPGPEDLQDERALVELDQIRAAIKGRQRLVLWQPRCGGRQA